MDHVNTVLITLTALVSALGGLVPVVLKLWKRVSKQEQRLRFFWRSRIMRGMVEGLARGYISEQIRDDSDEPCDADTEEITVAVTPFVFDVYAPIVAKLLDVRKKNPEVDQIELAELIEERFGPWIVANICIGLGVTEYACIVMALSIADGNKPVEIKGSKHHNPIGPSNAPDPSRQ